jgi:hypothetical protein
MAITFSEIYSGSVAVGASEISLVSGSTTLQNVTDDVASEVHLSLSSMGATDHVLFKIKEKVRSGDSQEVYEEIPVFGNGVPTMIIYLPILLHGWDVTMTQISGTPTIRWSIRKPV